MNEITNRWASEQGINASVITSILQEMNLMNLTDATSDIDIQMNTYSWDRLQAGFERLVSNTEDESSPFFLNTYEVEDIEFPYTKQSIALYAGDWTVKIAERLILDRPYKLNVKDGDVRLTGKVSFHYSLAYDDLSGDPQLSEPKNLTVYEFEVNGNKLNIYIDNSSNLHVGGLFSGTSPSDLAEVRTLIPS